MNVYIRTILCVVLCLTALTSCGGAPTETSVTTQSETVSETVTETETAVPAPDLSQYVLVRPDGADEYLTIFNSLRAQIKRLSGVELTPASDLVIANRQPPEFEILLGQTRRELSQSLYESLPVGGYAVVYRDGKIAIAGRGDEPLAAALGTGINIGGPRGTMMVDIGGGTTEVAVISMGGIVASCSVRVAGDELDAAIVEHIKKTRNVLIGLSTAEELKIRIGAAHTDIDRGALTVSGMSLMRRMGVTLEISTSELREAMEEPLSDIISTIKQAMEQTPPELSSDLYDFGIALTGGSSLIPGLGRLISERTGVRVRLAQRPMESVCRGILRVIDSAEELEGLLRFRER